MPDNATDFSGLMERVMAGDPDAARQLTEEYGPHLLEVVRRRLNPKLRPKFDSLDFMQDIWASFFAVVQREHGFAGPEPMLAYLTQLARNKVVDAVRQRLRTQKYNVNRERPLHDATGDHADLLPARDATPSTCAMSREEWERLLATQPLVYRHILLRLRDGATPGEIARILAVPEKLVRRLKTKLLPGASP